ncbi:fibronectin type III domain-containing protein [Rothia sp. ARF10]|nr:fibronectin type III domain-containing protein [Rothia sp. ARF10]
MHRQAADGRRLPLVTALVVLFAFALTSAPDARAADEPTEFVAKSLTWSTQAVDVTHGPATVVVTVEMPPGPQNAPRLALLESETSTQAVQVDDTWGIDPTPESQTFTFQLQQGAAPGRWKLSMLYVLGTPPEVVPPPGVSRDLDVTSVGADVDPPRLVSLTAGPDEVNVAYRSREVKVTATITDAHEIVGARLLLAGAGSVDLVPGEGSDVYTGTLTVAKGTEPGSWPVRVASLVDSLGNRIGEPDLPSPATVRVIHAPDVPLRPLFNSFTARARGALTVEWEPDWRETGSPVTGYQVTLVPTGRTVTVGATVRESTFTGLGDGTRHAAEIRAFNALGAGDIARIYEVGTWELPLAPTQVSASPRRTLVDLSWKRPDFVPGGVTSYVVTAHPGGQKRTTQSDVPSLVFDGLPSGTDHSFTVAATNGVGTGPSSSPSAPVRLVTERGAPVLKASLSAPDMATVTWARPSGFDTMTSTEVCRQRADGTTVHCVTATTNRASFGALVAGRTHGFRARSSEGGVWGPWSSVTWVTTTPGTGVAFTPTAPRRILDTRTGLGAVARPVGPGQTLVVAVPGLPAGTTSVTLNLTGLAATAPTFVTAHAAGTSRPTASHLNIGPTETLASFVTVPVSEDGKVALYNSKGTVHLVADLAGHVHPSGTSTLVSEAGTRILDTRYGTGAPDAPVGQGEAVTLSVPRRLGQVPTAAVLNLTVTGATKGTYVTAYPAGTVRPNASSVNVAQGRTVANLVVVPLDPQGRVRLWNAQGSVELVADLVGTYSLDSGAGYVPVAPTRLMDTRTLLGGSGAIGATPVSLTLPNTPAEAKAVLLRTTVVSPTARGNLVAHPAITESTGSVLNFVTGQTVGNHVVLPIQNLPTGRTVRFAMSSGVQGHLLVDVAGYYVR